MFFRTDDLLNLELVKKKSKVKESFLKLFHKVSFFLMLLRGQNFREHDPRPSPTEAAIEIFLENSCALYNTQVLLYHLIQFFEVVSKLKMSKLSIKGILEKLDKLNKSTPLRYMINGIKKEKTKILSLFDPMVWVLSNGVVKTPL